MSKCLLACLMPLEDVLVAIPSVGSHAPDLTFDVEQFKYNESNDTYTCPANEILSTNGNW